MQLASAGGATGFSGGCNWLQRGVQLASAGGATGFSGGCNWLQRGVQLASAGGTGSLREPVPPKNRKKTFKTCIVCKICRLCRKIRVFSQKRPSPSELEVRSAEFGVEPKAGTYCAKLSCQPDCATLPGYYCAILGVVSCHFIVPHCANSRDFPLVHPG